MKTLSVKDAKYGFGRLIDLARAEPVAVANHGRSVVVVMAVEKYERLKFFETVNVDSRPSTTGEGRMMDQAIHNKIVALIRGIEANLGSRSYITPDSRTLSADAKKSEPPRWR